MTKLHLPMYMMCDGSLGCDCPAKRKQANRKWRGGPPQHGERRMYQMGCHCTPCENANRAYQNNWRANKEKN